MRTPRRPEASRPRIAFPFLVLLASLLSAAAAGAAPAVPFRVAVGPDPGALGGPALGAGTLVPLGLALADFLVATDPVSGFAAPGLAESWTASDGGRTWTFTLKAARWSDGSPLEAQAVADAWTRSPGAPDALGNVLLSAEAPEPRRLRAVFRDPVPSAAVFATWRYAVLAADPESLSAGPFAVEARTPGRTLTAVKNSRYRDAASVRFSRVTFTFTDRPGLAELLYRKGEVDWSPHGGGPGTAVDPGLKDAVVAPGWGSTFLRFNLVLVPGNDPALRKTLAAALDRPSLAAELRGPLSLPSRTLVPPSSAPAETKKAKPLPLTGVPAFTVLHPAGETSRRLAEAVAAQWSGRLGLAVSTKEVSYADYLNDRKRGLYQAAVAGWLGDYPDPLAFLETFRSDSPANDTGWSDPAFDALVDRISALPFGKTRDKACAEAEALLLAAQPLVPLLSQASVNQINLKKWSGWYPNPTDRHPWNGFGPRK